QTFVQNGGVVLDLAQPDVPGEGVPYLPNVNWRWGTSGPYAVRTDADFSTIYPVATNHPLVSALPVTSGQVLTGRNSTHPRTPTPEDPRTQVSVFTSWESLGAWKEMRVLLACATGAAGFPAALLEGRNSYIDAPSDTEIVGKGRYLVSSLIIDKCYDTAGQPIQSTVAIDDSRKFFNALIGYVQKAKDGTAPAVGFTLSSQAGPLVGHVSETTARLWARPGVNAGLYPTWKCEVRVKATGVVVQTVTASISTANDDTLLVDVTGLQANTAYTYEFASTAPNPPSVPMKGSFTTAPVAGTAAKVTLGMGSCAHTMPNSLWKRVKDEGCDGFVMLGDTPYADGGHKAIPGAAVGSLSVVRGHHREFLASPELANMARSIPVWATWDDHDFGANNGFGNTVPSKGNYRQAFVDYRANATFGHATNGTSLTSRTAGEGVYTSFRRGPIEVFLIDPRWFSNYVNGDLTNRVCMGQVQKEWLFNALSASTATFKVLASGMTWYKKVGGENDHWGTFQVDKDAIFNYIKQNRISGCVLVSGDIHVSRALNNGNIQVGYDLWEYVTSPIHRITAGGTHTDTPPELKWNKAEPYTFLKLEADTTGPTATLTAKWINRDGVVQHTQTRTLTELTRP
ncbi:alkaline phosphatase D family protein, partial [Kitasatospora sp. NPDC001574]